MAESPLTGPGAGGFALVRPADGRPARVADFFVATPGRGRPAAAGAEMHAVDVGFGGDSETTQVFRIGEASCAVPGATAGLAAVHAAYGRMPWREVIRPSIELALAGVELTRPQAHLHAILDLILRHAPEGRRLYSRADGARLQPGDTLVLPDLAETLERISADGPDVVYRGDLTASIVETVAAGGGTLTREDLEEYDVEWREPVRVPYLGHEVVSNPPPSSGGVLIAYGLALLERIGHGAAGSTEAVASLAEVMREQTRARAGEFVDTSLLSDESLAVAVARIQATQAGRGSSPAPLRDDARLRDRR